jgi:hypothetical protein
MDPKERDEAMEKLRLLADQVGVRCADCGEVIHGSVNIGAVSWMTPVGLDQYQARAYCETCAEMMCDDD